MIHELELKSFRCFKYFKFTFSAGLNFVYGLNGSGKTSILEAIYLAGRARSFRSHYYSDLVNHDATDSIIFVKGQQNNSNFRIGCQIKSTNLIIKLNNDILRKRTFLLDYLPLQIITPTSHQLIDSGPSHRRKFIDWGLFHVEQSYRNVWSQFSRVLKQRNQALKSRGSEIKTWDEQFVLISNSLNDYREKYFDQISDHFKNIQIELLGEKFADLSYFAGWNVETGLQSELDKSRTRDVQSGYTHFGPQKSDIKFIFSKSKRNILSRGQQKMLVFSLQLSQCLHLFDTTGLSPVLLIDDISSELDKNYLNRLLTVVQDINLQSIISTIDTDQLDKSFKENMFHVEHKEDN